MWCWGCDVRHPDGNLLIRHRLMRHASPDPRFHSAYRAILPGGTYLTLWGWGIWSANREWGTLFIPRSHFRPQYTAHAQLCPSVWQVTHIPRMNGPCDPSEHRSAHCLLHHTFLWVSRYETWVQTVMGPGYRERAVASWPQRRRLRGMPADEMALSWRNLADSFMAGHLQITDTEEIYA